MCDFCFRYSIFQLSHFYVYSSVRARELTFIAPQEGFKIPYVDRHTFAYLWKGWFQLSSLHHAVNFNADASTDCKGRCEKEINLRVTMRDGKNVRRDAGFKTEHACVSHT